MLPRDNSCLRTGFTLIEVLLAVVVFAASLALFSRSFIETSHALRAIEADPDREQHARLLRRHVLAIGSLEDVERGGDFAFSEEVQASWRASVHPTPIADLFELRLSFTLPAPDGSAREQEATLLVLRPAWDRQGDAQKLLAERADALRQTRKFLP